MTPELWQYFYFLLINLGACLVVCLFLLLSGAAKYVADVLIPVFQEVSKADGKTLVFSWRKALTALVGINFVVSNQGQVWFGAKEMTAAASGITSMVFVFYFGKEILNRINIGKTETPQ